MPHRCSAVQPIATEDNSTNRPTQTRGIKGRARNPATRTYKIEHSFRRVTRRASHTSTRETNSPAPLYPEVCYLMVVAVLLQYENSFRRRLRRSEDHYIKTKIHLGAKKPKQERTPKQSYTRDSYQARCHTYSITPQQHRARDRKTCKQPYPICALAIGSKIPPRCSFLDPPKNKILRFSASREN